MACRRDSIVKANNCVHSLMLREYKDISAVRLTENLIRKRLSFASNLYRNDLTSHFGCVNAIEFSNNGQWLTSGGDDKRVLLWNVEKAISGYCLPESMRVEHGSNIFCLSFDSLNRKILSAGNDEQVFVHEVATGQLVHTVTHTEAIYALSVDPHDDNVFATACSSGCVYLFDSRTAYDNQWDAVITLRSGHPFQSVMHNPVESCLIATANIRDGVELWDTRSPNEPIIRFTDCLGNRQTAMAVRVNLRGTQILALRRRMPAVLYNITSPFPVAEFEHETYYNSCTMKSCCFAGPDDEYVVSGSDDFRLYVWKIPEVVMQKELSRPEQCEWVDEAQMVLQSHRSIVNQVRFNYSNSMLASSGVEKIIKLWSAFPLPSGTGSLESCPSKESRKVYSHEDYIHLVLESGHFMTHDYSHESCQEDSRMMAFFDSLVQRDIEGWTTDSDSDELDDGWNHYTNLKSSSSTSGDEDEDALLVLKPHTLSYVQNLLNRIQSNHKQGPASSSTGCRRNDNNDTPIDQQSSSQRLAWPTMASPSNKLCHLLHEKKRELLRKVCRTAVASTRKKLKKIRKYCEPVQQDQPQTSVAAENAARFQSLTELADKLHESIEAEAKTCAEENQNRRSRYKLRRRLRYLTSRSDNIINEIRSDSSDDSDSSDSSDGPIDRGTVWRALRGSLSLLNVELSDLPDSSSGSGADDSGSETEPEGRGPKNEILAGVRTGSGSESEDEWDENCPCSASDKETQVDGNRLQTQPCLLEEQEQESQQSAETAPDQESKNDMEVNNNNNNDNNDGVNRAKRYRCLCDSSTSGSCDNCTDHPATSQSVSFKTVNQTNRSYRKRKLADESSSSQAS